MPVFALRLQRQRRLPPLPLLLLLGRAARFGPTPRPLLPCCRRRRRCCCRRCCIPGVVAQLVEVVIQLPICVN